MRRRLAIALLILAFVSAFAGAQNSDSESSRKVKNRVVPVYPELAKKLKLVATVKVQVTIAPSGNVTQAKALGGHPLLITPSVDAAKMWRYEAAPETTTSVIEFHFAPVDN